MIIQSELGSIFPSKKKKKSLNDNDRTITEKLMYIPNDNTQNWHFCRLQLVVETSWKQLNEPTNQNSITVQKLIEPTNKNT